MFKFIKYLPLLIKFIPKLSKIADTFKGDDMSIKDGIKTTEWWGKVIVQVIAIVGMFQNIIPAEHALALVAVLEGIYNIMRTLVKVFQKKELPPLPTKPA